MPKNDRLNGEPNITLGLLDAIGENSQVSQRKLSSELGIALGLTNSYLKRCVRKGWVKVKTIPANRYAYFLTPKGFTEKSRLTAGYLSRSLSFYRQAKNQCDELLGQCNQNGWENIALFGAGDLAEIALVCAMRKPINIIGIIQPEHNEEHFLGFPIFSSVAEIGSVDGILFTEYVQPQSLFESLIFDFDVEKILIPDLLKITRKSDATHTKSKL